MSNVSDEQVTQIAKDLLARPTASWAYALSNLAGREPSTPGWTSEQVLKDLEALGLIQPSGWYAEVTPLGQRVATEVRLLAPVRWEREMRYGVECELCRRKANEEISLRAITDVEPSVVRCEHIICLNCLGEVVANACKAASEEAD